MTNPEFDNQFDVLYNSITSNQAPGLDTYEKSVFLTKAQDEILLSYFDPLTNKVMEGFDGSSRRQIDFSMVTSTKSYKTDFESAAFDPRPNSKSIATPGNVLLMLNERLIVNRENRPEMLTVIPIHFQEYDRLMSKPYKRPLKYQAWRVFNSNGTVNKSDLIVGPDDEIKEYTIRYIRRPRPIIIGPLDGLTIDGVTYDATKECELDKILHQEILQRAVELAKAAYTGDLTSQVSIGNNSQTQIGVVPQSNRQ